MSKKSLVPIQLPADPTQLLEAVPKQYVDKRITICTSSTRPSSPIDGQLIYETDTDRLYVYNGSAWYYLSGGTDPTAFRATITANQALTVGSHVDIPFTTEDYDYGTAFSSPSYTIPRTGIFEFSAQMGIASPASAERFIMTVIANGTTVISRTDLTCPIASPARLMLAVTGRIALSATNTVKVRMQQVNGTARQVAASTEGDSFFQGRMT